MLLLNIHPLLLRLVASALLHLHQPVPITLSSVALLLLLIMPLGSNPDEGDHENAERRQRDGHLKGARELEHGVRRVRGPGLVGRVDGRRDAHGQGRGQADQGVHDAAGEALRLAGKGLHDVHVSDVELEVGADDVEDQGREHEGPVVAVGAHERQEEVGHKVGQRAGGHEDRVVDAVQDVADDDVPEQARQGLREEVHRDEDGGPCADFLHEEGEVKGGGLEGHEAQDGDGHDLGDDLMVACQLVGFVGTSFTGTGMVLYSLTRLKFLSFQINGGISGNEYFVSHQMNTTKRTNPMIMRHRVTGDVQPSVGPRLQRSVSMRECFRNGWSWRGLRDTSREHASAEQSQTRP